MTNEIKPINMPKWGMEMSEGDINAWYFAVGDQVNAGDDLVDIETSKIINTVTATDSGILRAILGATGETHAVGALLGVIASAETSDADIQAFINSNSSAAAEPEAVTEAAAPVAAAVETAPAPAPAPAPATIPQAASGLSKLAEGEDDSLVAASPVARRLAAEYGVNLNNITGTGRHDRVSKRDLEAAVVAAGGQLIGNNRSAS
ncbi:E3 binding domain-containing protein, partial [Porticoccaceae bacterium]|nr:E3 binding domain-containing protein [Porticoccaceae bacterium]